MPAAPGGVDEALLDKAGKLIGEAERIAVIFGSGISDREESLNALLNFCLLKGLPGQGAIIPTSLQANARGAAALLGAATSPEDVLFSPDTAGIVIYEEDPFQFLNAREGKGGPCQKGICPRVRYPPDPSDGFRPSDDSLHNLSRKNQAR